MYNGTFIQGARPTNILRSNKKHKAPLKMMVPAKMLRWSFFNCNESAASWESTRQRIKQPTRMNKKPKYIEKNGDIDISINAEFTTMEITIPSTPPTHMLKPNST